MTGTFRAGLAALALLMLPACASLSATPNAPLGETAEPGYRLISLAASENADEAFIIIAFSGGGKRSAAFGYGALKGLAALQFGGDGARRSLLSDADVLSGVSGGTFVAATYGLQREAMFGRFEDEFLTHDFNAEIIQLYALPWRWDWMVNPNWGTNDEMARVYDETLFHGATYADLIAKGRPLIIVQATALATGAPFVFGQDNFDLLCSDLSSYPLSRAVAASNGFPVLFTPITLTNHRSKACALAQPAWIAEGLKDPDELSLKRMQAELAQRYLDQGDMPYVHLVDGGVADNLALRGPFDTIERRRGAIPSTTRRVLVISVDGQAEQDKEVSRVPVVGDVLRILDAVTGGVIDRSNIETLRYARSAIERLAAEETVDRCARGEKPLRAYFAHISLKDAPDAEELKRIPTGLTIKRQFIWQLVVAGEKALEAEKTIQRFITEFNEPDACPAAANAY